MRNTLAGLLLLPALLVAQEPPKKLEDFRFDGRTLGGQHLTQEAFRDGVLIVDLWGTWCPPCRAATPKLVALYEQYKQHGLEIVGFAYAQDGSSESADSVRKYAIENRITYPLLVGDPNVRQQVPGFEGYPTMLVFSKGLHHETTRVGFSDGSERELTTLVRSLLGIDAEAEKSKAGDGEPEPTPPKEDVAAGAIWQPGQADKGFDFELTDIDGKPLHFADLRGKPVVLALTTTYDLNAVRTAELLSTLASEHADVRVIAACIEKDRDVAKKVAAVRAFRDRHGLKFTLLPADLAFAMARVHKFAALPTLLLFDPEGTLVLREGGLSETIAARVRAKLTELLPK